jgi:hypothetical protein
MFRHCAFFGDTLRYAPAARAPARRYHAREHEW